MARRPISTARSNIPRRYAPPPTGFLNAYGQAGHPTQTHSGFNEFDHVDILQRYDNDALRLARLGDFEHIFRAAFQRWQSGEYDDEYNENWPQFKQRCILGLNEIIAKAGAAKTILVFTSGGAISVILQHLLQLPNQPALRLNQQIRNASLTRLLFNEARISVDYINNFSHLEQAGHDWVTYR